MRIRLLSYNIHRAIGLDRRFRPERIVEILAHHDADIVLLQEVDDGVPRSREIDLAGELAASLGYPHLAVGHNVSLRKGRYGNATLTRFPILRERNIDLTIGSHKRRGCQHTTLEISHASEPDRILEVFNLHMGLSARERERQTGVLIRSREFRRISQETPCIVGGDFNDWRSRLRGIFVEGVEFQLASELKNGRAIRTYPSISPRGGLDRFYSRGSIRSGSVRTCRMAVSRIASDHLPLIADFFLS